LRYFILAGEASGDKQAALLCAALRQHDPGAVIRGWGGEEMAAQGADITRHYRELAFMGFVEVVRHLPAILRNFRLARKQILDFEPDALILVDYPGFNLRMAKWAAKRNIRVYYYISPQLWAWHTSRVHQIRKAVRRMYAILPFEEAFYAKFGVSALYIGHPLAMAIRQDGSYRYAPEAGRIALLPGSRRHEVERLLPVMADLARRRPADRFVVAAVPHLPASIYTSILAGIANATVVVGDMRGVLAHSAAAVVTSGTATLETALLGVPQVVVYKGSPLSYQIAKRLIKVPYISLVNLIADGPLVPELIQAACTAEGIDATLATILQPERLADIRSGYAAVADALVSGGGADAAAMDLIADIRASIPR
jgi:lipid-A-disaccharide synthase